MPAGKVDVVLGSQWGDEGKGKLVDTVGCNYDICCRATGGANAGHTVVVDGKSIAFHLIPIGLLQPSNECIIGNGVVINIPSFFDEVKQMNNLGLSVVDRLYISDRAHIVFNFHQLCDGIVEAHKGANKIGTTKRGIGPTYASKMERVGIRMGALKNWDAFVENYKSLLAAFQERYGPFEYDSEGELAFIKSHLPELVPMIKDTVEILNKALADNKKVLVEGCNAIMLDIDFGTYPFVTSSNASIGGILTGLGIGPKKIGTVWGIVKAYTTRVGEGPFPTELLNDLGEHIRQVGHEFGATTGRPRRCGWLDITQISYSNAINDYDSVCLTKLDVLSDLDVIKIGVAYKYNGEIINTFPADLEELKNVEVVYEEMPGWKADISNCRTFEELPEKCQQYVRRIEELAHIKVQFIGVGADRDSVITLF
ncbi:hypothetical protein WA158_004273 [Blastocystis sp. Blastoise]